MNDERDFADQLASCLAAFAHMTDTGLAANLLADAVGCAHAANAVATGSSTVVTRALDYARDEGVPDRGCATIWANGETSTPEAAAFANGVAVRYLDYNDTYVGKVIVHPSDMIPALVALAEARRADWPRLLEAVGVAYETLCRTADQSETRSRGWDPATLVPIAVAAGCAWLNGLDQSVSASAIRLAALDAGTLRCIRLGKVSDWKAAASARGAAKALFAVRMAEMGTMGPIAAFSAEDGFFNRVSGALTMDVSGGPRLAKVMIKSYPAQIFIQPLLALAGALAGTVEGDIESIDILTSAQAIKMVGPRPGLTGTLNRETADHDAAFCVALMLSKRRFTQTDIEPALTDENVLALSRKVRMNAHEEGVEVRVTMADGRVEVRREAPGVGANTAVIANKLNDIWPARTPRGWPWKCYGKKPDFPASC